MFFLREFFKETLIYVSLLFPHCVSEIVTECYTFLVTSSTLFFSSDSITLERHNPISYRIAFVIKNVIIFFCRKGTLKINLAFCCFPILFTASFPFSWWLVAKEASFFHCLWKLLFIIYSAISRADNSSILNIKHLILTFWNFLQVQPFPFCYICQLKD